MAWDDRVRDDIVALGGRDPGPPPVILPTDGEVDFEWVEDPPPPKRGTPRRRRTEQPPTDPTP